MFGAFGYAGSGARMYVPPPSTPPTKKGIPKKNNSKTKNIEQIVIDYRIKKLILNPMNIK
tara:strand:+ start:1714 stop:1893 length:180 start_codon:yes stop_codon:yes gene_type:complete